jgi:valyl-tRNA synthetase
MSLSKHYDPGEVEPRLRSYWQERHVYHFSEEDTAPVYSIDTPPATVSGNLHLGHVYSYTHADLLARYWRMQGFNVFYPMGYDDNGLPTERLVEKKVGATALQIGRPAFIANCLRVSIDAEREYEELWQRLGLSIDWRFTYRTIDDDSRRISQASFIELYDKKLVYRKEAPAIWCPECHTSIAQAELNDLERDTEFVTLVFEVANGKSIPIATTRPELLPACVAIFVHPEDERYQGLAGHEAIVPLYGQRVTIYEDTNADPRIGTGAVMCCTFGDTTDIAWWYAHRLPLIQAIDRDGRMTGVAGEFSGMPVMEARREIKQLLEKKGDLQGYKRATQSVRVHERCDTPVEYIVLKQWFINVLDFKERFLEAGARLRWHPENMISRYKDWVDNLTWDWCISRQRYFGVPFPLWYCHQCGEVLLASLDQLPIDPSEQNPDQPCPHCGGNSYLPEMDVLDTWATSSLSPQIVGRWMEANGPMGMPSLFDRVYPFSLRPQAHEIIRTWAFYTIVKSQFHFDALPWKEILISGWGLAGEGMGKISKSRGGGSIPPLQMIQRYSADAVRYWAASTGPGKDALISEEKIQSGAKLVTKLWNVARFSEPFLSGYTPSANEFTPADRWVLSLLQKLIRSVTALLEECDYATSKSEMETFFWTVLTDNYLEMSKQRLYDPGSPTRDGARFTLSQVLLTVLKLFAPFLPFVTEEIYLNLFPRIDPGSSGVVQSIHRARWPDPNPALEDSQSEVIGGALVEIARHIRRYKSEHNLPLGKELAKLQLIVSSGLDQQQESEGLRAGLLVALPDLKSISRAREIEVQRELDSSLILLNSKPPIGIAIDLGK